MIDTNPVEFDPFAGPEISLIAPATEPQVEIWTSCLIGGDAANCAYNECFSLLLTGVFNTGAMIRALQDLVNMHEALRTSFSADGKSICVYKELTLDIDYQDISLSAEDQRQKIISAYNRKIALTPFNLITGPLFKAALFKLSENEHLLTFVAHHIVCDGWSIGIMMQDLSKLYSAYASRQEISLPAPPLFSGYALSQMAQANSESNQETEQYWIDQFIGSGHLLDIPTDFPRPALRTYKSHREDLILDGALANDVKKLARANGASFVTTLLAAFEVFLKQLTGQEEIIVGLPAAGQPATDNFRLVGHCVNLLALRSFPKSNISFRQYLKLRRSEVLDAYEHQLFTFGSLLKKLNIPRDPSRLPLVPVMFNIDMGLDDDVDFFQLHHKLISNPREYENFEIFLNIAGHEESPTLEWSYNTQLFKSSTIKKMMDSFEFLLHELVKNPDTLIGKIQTMDSAELHHLYARWNDTGCPYPDETPLHNLIAKQAAENPQKIAINFNGQNTTYRELDENANRLAAVLIKNGVNRGDKVAFSLDRSAEMVVIMLAVMKAGAIYIPLDPIFPVNRINYMLEDSQAVVLIISENYKGKYQSNAKELIVEDVWQSLSEYPSTAPDVNVSGNDLVYILYTSGSTGLPKGVQIAHHNLVNFLYSMQKQPGLTLDDKLLAVTTISFDIAGLELWLPLLTGAEIILADAATAKDGRALLDIIKNEKATVMQATPYTWRILLEAGWNETLPLKVICGGEALPAELAERILAIKCSMWNVYGPTETTIWSTVKEISSADKINIGRPIDNTSIYILDKFLKPLGPGIPGEIYIGGAGVAKGYLNRPELTAEKFVADPFSNIPGSKMYNTGDLGRFTHDGEIECLGRADSQVKIRGYRIETGEIEYQLVNSASVKQAVVIARPDNFGIDKLVAFVAGDNIGDEGAAIQRWRDALKASLPDYMIPDNFVILDSMPLTPNGKVDKKALAKVGVSVVDTSHIFVAPRTDVEQMVADIWKEYLGIEKIGVYDNFFELGGHSLIAVQVMTRIEKETGKRLPLAALFETSTIEKLALMLEMDGRSITWDSLVPIKPKGNKMPLYMVHGAGLNVLLFNTLAMNMAPDQPVYGLQAKGLDGVEEPLGSIEEIAAHYIDAIMKQNPDGPYALAGYSFGGIIAYEMAKQFKELGKEVKVLAMFDTYAYRSPHYDPVLIKFIKRSRFFLDKMKYMLTSSSGIKETVAEKKLTVSRRLKRVWWRLKYGKEQKQEGFFGYSNKIDEMNNLAERRYQLKPFDVAVEVFRAENRTFYMDDFEYLGWKPYALKGVHIHPIPGEHNTIFKAPNDKKFAEVLQKCLDDAAKD
ncbi:MAG TPA: amino acid adenylation domain-containing protein [Mucilaginibacter sp.]|nr:amino acid adenylation domain-containing protein [Mucilaginibacter sp.]